jgi:hypothetical protein
MLLSTGRRGNKDDGFWQFGDKYLCVEG